MLEKERRLPKKLSQPFKELTEYLGRPIEDIFKEYWTNRNGSDRSKQKSIENASSEEEIIDYYRNTTQYLYELISWEAQKTKQQEYRKIYLFCKRFNCRRVLDYGGGVGGLCLYLTEKGILCDYLDVSGKTFEFAKYRFKKRNLDCTMISALDEPPFVKYDLVVTYDVLEHIYNLQSVIEKINKFLVSGGFLISKSTFSGGGIHLPKNEIYSNLKVFNDFLHKDGFNFVGQLKSDRFSRLLNRVGLGFVSFDIRISRRLKHGGNFVIHRKFKEV